VAVEQNRYRQADPRVDGQDEVHLASAPAAVLDALFAPGERLGWTYRPPAEEEAETESFPSPPALTALEPAADDVRTWVHVKKRSAQALNAGGTGLVVALLVLIIHATGPAGAALLAIVAACCALYVAYILATSVRDGTARIGIGAVAVVACFLPPWGLLLLSGVTLARGLQLRETQRYLHATYARVEEDTHRSHALAMDAWELRKRDAIRAEERRRIEAPLWHPVAPPRAGQSLSIFGGSAYGWEALLTTLGASLLGNRAEPVTILDVSTRAAAAELDSLAVQRGLAVRRATPGAPDGASAIEIVGGIAPNDLVDVLVEALHAGLGRDDPSEMVRERDILSTIREAIGPPATIARIRAALRVVLRREDPASSILSTAEIGQIGKARFFNDEVRKIPAMMQSVADMEARLAPLASLVGEPVSDSPESERRCSLGVVQLTRSTPTLTNGLYRGLLVQALVHALRQGRFLSGTIILVGADLVPERQLDALLHAIEQTRSARGQSAIRLISLFERLRGDAREMLGGGGGRVAFMRLDNAKEAAEACGYIGNAHTFKVTNLSRSTNRSVTHSTGTSQTATTAPSAGANPRVAAPFSGDTPGPGGRSWGATAGIATSEGDGTSVSEQRVYDLVVEPREIQRLPETSVCYVDMQGTQEPVLLDCNPDIVSLPRVGVGSADVLDEGLA